MKKNIAFIILFATVIVSCKKTSADIAKSELIGSWHLFSVISSLVEHAPDDSIVLTFQQNGKYIETNNNVVTAQGTYTIKSEQHDSMNETFIQYNPDLDNAPGAQAIRLNDTLVLIPEVMSTDGYELKYKKQ